MSTSSLEANWVIWSASNDGAKHDLSDPKVAANLAFIARRIKLLRYAATRDQPNIRSIKAFAPTIGFSTQAWSNYEQGIRVPALSEAIKLRSQFGISLDWLYIGDDRQMPKDFFAVIREEAKSPEFQAPIVLRDDKVRVNVRTR